MCKEFPSAVARILASASLAVGRAPVENSCTAEIMQVKSLPSLAQRSQTSSTCSLGHCPSPPP